MCIELLKSVTILLWQKSHANMSPTRSEGKIWSTNAGFIMDLHQMCLKTCTTGWGDSAPSLYGGFWKQAAMPIRRQLPNTATILRHIKLALKPIQVNDQGEYNLLKNISGSDYSKKQVSNSNHLELCLKNTCQWIS